MVNTPTLARRTLGAKLRRLRETAQVHVNDAAAHVGVDRTTVQRWEHGRTAPKVGIVRSLGELYRAGTAEVSRLAALASRSAERGIWEGAKVPPQLRALYEAESSAHLVRTVELDYIPGLLQTSEYMAAVQEAAPELTEEDRRAIRETFARRQDVMFKSRSTTMRFVFGQSALAYLRSRPEVQTTQVQRLLDISERPNVEIRVLVDLHPAMAGAFTIIDADDAGFMDPFVFQESADGCRYVETRDVVSLYNRIWRQVWTVAIPLEEYLNDTRNVA